MTTEYNPAARTIIIHAYTYISMYIYSIQHCLVQFQSVTYHGPFQASLSRWGLFKLPKIHV